MKNHFYISYAGNKRQEVKTIYEVKIEYTNKDFTNIFNFSIKNKILWLCGWHGTVLIQLILEILKLLLNHLQEQVQ